MDSRYLRVALLVCLWQGPLPWIHFHENPGQSTPPANAERLAQHFLRFHRESASFATFSTEWHLHFVMPWRVSEDGPCPVDSRPQDTCDHAALTARDDRSAAEPGADVLGAGFEWPSLCKVDGWLVRQLETHRFCVSQRTHFLPADSVSLCTLIGVARC